MGSARDFGSSDSPGRARGGGRRSGGEVGGRRDFGSGDSPARSLRTGRPRTSRLGSCPRSDSEGTAAIVRTEDVPAARHSRGRTATPRGGRRRRRGGGGRRARGGGGGA